MPAAIGDRSASTLMTIAPFGVVSVTVRVSPAGSAGGWLVGQVPPATADAPGLRARLPGWPRRPPPVPVPGRKTTRIAISATTAIAAGDQPWHDRQAVRHRGRADRLGRLDGRRGRARRCLLRAAPALALRPVSHGTVARCGSKLVSGSRGGLQGCWVIDGPGEEDLTEDDTGDAGVAQAAEPVQVADPSGHQDLGIVRPNELAGAGEVRIGAAVAEDEARDAGADQLADERRRRSAARAGARGRRPAAPAAGRGRRPASRRRPRGTPGGRPDGRRSPSSARPGSRRRRTQAGSPRPNRRRRRAGAGRPREPRPPRRSRGSPARRRGRRRSRRGGSAAPRAPRTAPRSGPVGRSAHRSPPRRRASRRSAIDPPRGRWPG